MAAKNLGELLVRENLIDLKQLEDAKREQKAAGGRLGKALIKLGYVKESELAEFLGRQFQVPSIDLDSHEIEPEALKSLTKETCVKHCVIPISRYGNNLAVAFADPTDVFARDDLTFLTKCHISVVVASEHGITKAIERYYGGAGKTNLGSILNEMEKSDDAFAKTQADGIDLTKAAVGNVADSPVVKFINLMLSEAIESRASDIHIEPYEKRTRVRFRIDGRLVEKTQPPPGLSGAIASRIKVMAKLDIAQRRLPQDGRIKVFTPKGAVDFRVSVLPTLFGEKCVLRLLDKSNLQLDMTRLGFEQDDLVKFKRAIRLPQGMVLITGPTGSGKTTTIYSALAELNTNDKNISTAEDPVEFNLDGINQVQINHEIKFGFSEALRSFLRQDPNIIMVGEIRDLETAEIAFKAASTGHLVVSTLHTNDAPATVVRLLDMGIPNFLITAGVNLIVAQRLLRTICTNCKTPHKVPAEVLIELGAQREEIEKFQVCRGEGCSSCNGSGMRGRVAIYELMEMTNGIKESIMTSSTPLQVKRAAIVDGMRTLRQSALMKLAAGLTTIDQVATATMSDI